MATLHPIGEPTNDSERQALRFLAQNLPDDYTVYGGAWLVSWAALSDHVRVTRLDP